ncbi:MAG: TRAP transporter substrate-binding protein [Clostridia bacterium]|nr:TRAP transporter substrate-binding protein [Clostridia bacterium]
MKKSIVFMLVIIMSLCSMTSVMAEVAPVGDPVTIIFGVQLAATTPFARCANDFAQMCRERSGGTINVEVYTDSVLGSEAEMWESIQMGTVDMMIISPAQISNYVPEYAVYDLPFLFSSYEHRDRVAESEAAGKLDALLEEKGDMVVLGQAGGTGRYLLTAKGPVTRMEDVAGIKMRVQASVMVTDTWKAFGTLPVTVAYGETYSALETGVAEACENELSTFITQKWYENCRYLLKTNHQINMRPILIGKSKFESLSPEQQQIVRQAGYEAGLLGVEYERNDEDGSFAELESFGVQISEIEDKQAWIDATEQLRVAFCEQYGVTEIYDEIMALAD